MSASRRRFLEVMAGARSASQEKLLLDPAGASVESVQAARLLRNGLAVTCFSAFEGFIRARTKEVASWLTSQSVPFSAYPSELQEAPLKRGVGVLAAVMRRDPDGMEVRNAVVEIGEAWSRMGTGGGWRLPHAALLWSGSNLTANDAVSILSCFGVAKDWNDVTGVAKMAGFTNWPTKPLFEEIAQRRHDAAHDADHDADIILLRATPANLTAFAFSLDVLISHAARAIARMVKVERGRSAVTLTRLDEIRGGGGWEEYSGPVDVKNAMLVNTHAADLGAAIADCQSRLIGPTDVLMVRHWDGAVHVPSAWYTMGV
jgi:hypothetical protein